MMNDNRCAKKEPEPRHGPNAELALTSRTLATDWTMQDIIKTGKGRSALL